MVAVRLLELAATVDLVNGRRRSAPARSTPRDIFRARRRSQSNELAGRLAVLSAGTAVVSYCRGSYSVMAHKAARTLTADVLSAARLSDGMLKGRVADLPVAN